MDQRIASLFFLTGVCLVVLGIYSSASAGAEVMLRPGLFPWGREIGTQVLGTVFAIVGAFGLLRGLDAGEEF
ncbi:MAG: hypothetical protein JWM16_2140 [Verrucomicrobiales bacterium]|nr:hypothetical protein [Verrucomicrobiales bacterium]